MARLKGLEREFRHAYQAALARLKDQETFQIFGWPKEEIFRRGEVIASTLWVYDELGRGMDFLKEKLRKDPSFREGSLVLALRLTAAKGRFQRVWLANEGGLWFSFALYDDFCPALKGWVPLLMGCALAEAARAFGAKATVKWINDVLVSGRKLAGILTENVKVGGENWLLIGIGFNVYNPLPPALKAVSLKEALGFSPRLSEVFGEIGARLAKYYGLLRAGEMRFLETGSHPFREIYLSFADLLGRMVAYGEDILARVEGRARVVDLDPEGKLILEGEGGARLILRSGEITYLD